MERFSEHSKATKQPVSGTSDANISYNSEFDDGIVEMNDAVGGQTENQQKGMLTRLADAARSKAAAAFLAVGSLLPGAAPEKAQAVEPPRVTVPAEQQVLFDEFFKLRPDETDAEHTKRLDDFVNSGGFQKFQETGVFPREYLAGVGGTVSAAQAEVESSIDIAPIAMTIDQLKQKIADTHPGVYVSLEEPKPEHILPSVVRPKNFILGNGIHANKAQFVTEYALSRGGGDFNVDAILARELGDQKILYYEGRAEKMVNGDWIHLDPSEVPTSVVHSKEEGNPFMQFKFSGQSLRGATHVRVVHSSIFLYPEYEALTPPVWQKIAKNFPYIDIPAQKFRKQGNCKYRALLAAGLVNGSKMKHFHSDVVEGITGHPKLFPKNRAHFVNWQSNNGVSCYSDPSNGEYPHANNFIPTSIYSKSMKNTVSNRMYSEVGTNIAGIYQPIDRAVVTKDTTLESIARMPLEDPVIRTLAERSAQELAERYQEPNPQFAAAQQ